MSFPLAMKYHKAWQVNYILNGKLNFLQLYKLGCIENWNYKNFLSLELGRFYSVSSLQESILKKPCKTYKKI